MRTLLRFVIFHSAKDSLEHLTGTTGHSIDGQQVTTTQQISTKRRDRLL